MLSFLHRQIATISVVPLIAVSFLTSAFADPIRVACLGDSITAGARVDPKTESYPARLQQLLGEKYEVRNFGVGGATLIKPGRPNVWQKLDEVKQYQPHVVVISLGTNDTVAGRRKNWQKIDRFQSDYSDLLNSLASLPSLLRIVVCTPTAMVLATNGLSADRLKDLKERQPRLQQLCDRIRDIATLHAGPTLHAGQGVSVLDLNAVLRDRPDLMTEGDGVHPNRDGYLEIARAVARKIASDKTD